MHCPVCRSDVDQGKTCDRCDSVHHGVCWEFVGHCAIYGCYQEKSDSPVSLLSQVDPDLADDVEADLIRLFGPNELVEVCDEIDGHRSPSLPRRRGGGRGIRNRHPPSASIGKIMLQSFVTFIAGVLGVATVMCVTDIVILLPWWLVTPVAYSLGFTVIALTVEDGGQNAE